MQRKQYEKKQSAGNGSRLKVGIVVSKFNEDITYAMRDGALEMLRTWRVPEKSIHIAYTYGSFELPQVAARLIKKHKLDAVVALGCIIKGETRHDEYLAHAAAHGLTRVSLDFNVPVGFGVITTNNLAQAKARSRGNANKGNEAALAALEATLI